MIGNRVVLRGEVDDKILDNLTGIILSINKPNGLLIAIDNWDKGHKGYTNDIPDALKHLNTGKNCWWVSPSNIAQNYSKTKEQLIIDKINYLDKRFKERHINLLKKWVT